MKKTWRRFLAGVLTVVILAGLLPTAAYAAVGELVGNSAVENAALLQTLKEMYGGDAEAMMAVLNQYGLLDEDGNIVTDEKIVMDGQAYTLDEIEAILNDPATDLSKVVEVDGQHLTLEELKKVVEIERYLAYLKATYFTEQDLTDEQVASFYSLAGAWANGEVMMLASNVLSGVGPAGVDHDVRLKVEGADTAGENGTYTVTVTPTKAQTKPITFSWRAVSGSAAASGGGEVTIPAGSADPVQLTVQVGEAADRTKGDATFLVQLYGLENALFEGGASREELSVTVPVSDGFRYYYYNEDFGALSQEGWGPWTSDSEIDGAYDIGKVEEVKNRKWSYIGPGGTRTGFGVTEGEYIWTISTPNMLRHKDYTYKDGTRYISDHAFTDTTGVAEELLSEVRVDVEIRDPSDGYRTVLHSEEFTATQSRGFYHNGWGVGFNCPAEWTFVAPSGGIALDLYLRGYYLKLNDGSDIAMYPDLTYDPVSLKMQENTTAAEVSFSAPEGTYYAGQNVPITADFGYPVKITQDMIITVNGAPLPPEEAGTVSERCTYLYPVDEASGTELLLSGTSFVGDSAEVQVVGANEIELKTAAAATSPIQAGGTAPGVTLEPLDRERAFGEPQLAVSKEQNQQPVLTVTIPLTGTPYDDWVLNEVDQESGVLNAVQMVTGQTGDTRCTFQVDDLQSPKNLTAEITLPHNLSLYDVTGQVDFLLDGQVMVGKGREYTQDGSKPVDRWSYGDAKVTIKYEDGSTQEVDNGGTYINLSKLPQIEDIDLSIVLPPPEEGEYTWGDTSKVIIYQSNDEKPENADVDAHFAWVNGSPDRAQIVDNQNGTFSLNITGDVTSGSFLNVSLYALNGGMADEWMGSRTIYFEGTATPDVFLKIPESGSRISVREGDDARIHWSSNICGLNKTAGENGAFVPTVFTVQLATFDPENQKFNVINQWTALTDEEKNPTISSFAIPWDEGLDTLYHGDRSRIMAFVSAEYQGERIGTYINEEGEPNQGDDSAMAIITLLSPPASVKLDRPAGGLYHTDNEGKGKDITLNWTADNLDIANGGQFELYIAGGGLDSPISVTTVGDKVTQNGNRYSYSLKVPEVDPQAGDPTSYRDSYTITVKVKNAADSAWAYDSYVLYVYSEDVLDILLDHGDVKTADGAYTMSNVERIRALWSSGGEEGSEAIVALRRDIALKNVISINYGDYAWAELADQIAWASSDSSVASVNYRQGALYENIENFSYTSYRPSTDFMLSGLKDGTTTITATHANTGITDSVTVNVETLRDQLYLFQCYPKARTTLNYTVYTDASRTATADYTMDTNEKGEAAIYAPYGIAGDIYCKSGVKEDNEEITYLGTIYRQSLVSSETDATKLQLYPVNTLRLRQAAQAEIYLKNPDGTPYVGEITFRGGVYRQGEYCTGDGILPVKFGLQGEKDRMKWQEGSVPQTVKTGDTGRLLVTMDLSQFKTSGNQTEVKAGEKLCYLFQLECGNGASAEYYPIFLRVDANLNVEDIAASGDSIVAWKPNESGQKHPYIVQQTLKYSQSLTANAVDLREETGKVGPSATFPNAYITTSVMWWGDEYAKDDGRVNSVLIQDTTGKTPACQTSKTTTYPFTDLMFTENVMSMDESGMEEWGIPSGAKRNVQAVLSKDGITTDRTISLPFQIVNMTGVEKAEDSGALKDSLDYIKDGLDVDAGGSVGGIGNGDIMIEGGMDLLGEDANYDPEEDKFAVYLYATTDPTVFRALFGVNLGELNRGGVYPEYDDPENMTFIHGDSSTAKNSELEAVPGVGDIYSMIKGNYLSGAKEEAERAAAGKGVQGAGMALGGYVEADISYNSESGKWECKPISGGFNVGGGVNYNWNFNAVVGIIPVTASVTLGGTLEVRMDMQRGSYYEVSSGMDALKDADTEEKFDNALADASYVDATGNDYLTNLRIFFYMRAFAGVGFDISVVAFKIGVFGQLNLDLQYKWLNRNYLDGGGNISAVGPVSSRTDSTMTGASLQTGGSTGIEFVFKFLFISYEKIFCSIGFEEGAEDAAWKTIEEIWKDNKTINGSVVTRMAMPNGQVMYAVDLGAQLERRDYVDAAEQEWLGGQPSISLFGLDETQGVADVLQSGAYPYANPVLSDDGQVMFYLSDRGEGAYVDAKDVTNTRVAVSTKQNGQFQEGMRLNSGYSDNSGYIYAGYGDSSVKIAGSDGNYAAVWVRQTEDMTWDSDDGSLDEGQQMLQMNSTEIIAAIPDENGEWQLEQLTYNSTPDLAPVVATNGTRTIVAWREVNSTGADKLTSFDQQDAIRFAVCEEGQWQWKEDELLQIKCVDAQTLYDGTGSDAAVKGLEIAMLEDGTAAVVYTLDTDSTNDSSADWETVLAIIPAGGAEGYAGDGTESEDAVRTFRLTSDANLDENPQITAVKFEDETQRFVAAWHTERAITGNAGGETESDIRLAVLDKKGVLYQNMPESLSMATGGTGDTIGANFRFAKNAEGIEDLSILWVDTVSGEADSNSYSDIGAGVAAGYSNMGHDVLKAVKFVPGGSSYTLSGTVEVAEMRGNTLIDHFDACWDGQELKSVILGTNYDQTSEREVTVSDGQEDKPMKLTVANPISGMHTATAEFTNQIQETAVMLEYKNLYPNSDIDVQFMIRNSGKDAVTKLEILSGGETVYTSRDTGMDLLPNRDVIVTARFPTGETVENADYTIKATFAGDETVELPGTLHLDMPDAGISKVETIKEESGERTLRYSLYNALSAKLADAEDGWRVKVGFYADQGCTTPLKDASGQDAISVIDRQTELALIDGGGYSAEVTLPVESYMQGEDGAQEEIPNTGIPVYAKVWIEAPVKDPAMQAGNGTDYDSVSEYFTGNNTTSLTLENLAVRRGEDVTIQQTLENSNGVSKVDVSVQYNKLSGTTSGNLIVTLLDQEGDVLAEQQSYTPGSGENNGFVTLGGEEKGQLTFTFDKPGASVRVAYTDAKLEEPGNTMIKLQLQGISPEYDESTKTWYISSQDAARGSALMTIATEDPRVTITVDGIEYKTTVTQTLPGIGSNIPIVVTAQDGTETTYYLAARDDGTTIPVTSVSMNKTSLELAVSASERLTATVEPDNATNKGLTWSSSNTSVATVDASGNVNAVSAGAATITVTTEDGGKTAACAVTVTAAPTDPDHGGSGSGGSGSPSYGVDTDADIDHGTVTVKPSRAEKGDTVTVTAKPDEGYRVGKVTVTDKNGDPVKVTDKGDGVYAFTMPASAVSVDVTFVPEGQWTNPFVDVPEDAWYYGAVKYVNENGLMAGTGASTFAPNLTATRGMIVTILYRLEGSPNIENEIWGYPFKDVDASAYYATAVYWARMNGIVAGYSDELFGPNDIITREQMAAILYRYAQYKDYDTTTKADLSKYTDAVQVGSWATDAIRWANAAGLVNGTSVTTLTPKGSATRAQVAVILTRFCQNILK